MSVWGVIIIVLALGIIVSNIMLVKKTANMKMPDSVLKKAEKERLYEQQLRENESESESKDTDAKPSSGEATPRSPSNEESQ